MPPVGTSRICWRRVAGTLYIPTTKTPRILQVRPPGYMHELQPGSCRVRGQRVLSCGPGRMYGVCDGQIMLVQAGSCWYRQDRAGSCWIMQGHAFVGHGGEGGNRSYRWILQIRGGGGR